MQCYRRAMRISYVEHVTNEEVLRRVGQSRGLLGQVKSNFGHTTRHASLEKDHAGHHAQKTSARWSEETVDR